jgi:hypothetical protein
MATQTTSSPACVGRSIRPRFASRSGHGWHGGSGGAVRAHPMVVEGAGGDVVEYEGLGHYLGPEHHDEWAAWLVATT